MTINMTLRAVFCFICFNVLTFALAENGDASETTLPSATQNEGDSPSSASSGAAVDTITEIKTFGDIGNLLDEEESNPMTVIAGFKQLRDNTSLNVEHTVLFLGGGAKVELVENLLFVQKTALLKDHAGGGAAIGTVYRGELVVVVGLHSESPILYTIDDPNYVLDYLLSNDSLIPLKAKKISLLESGASLEGLSLTYIPVMPIPPKITREQRLVTNSANKMDSETKRFTPESVTQLSPGSNALDLWIDENASEEIGETPDWNITRIDIGVVQELSPSRDKLIPQQQEKFVEGREVRESNNAGGIPRARADDIPSRARADDIPGASRAGIPGLIYVIIALLLALGIAIKLRGAKAVFKSLAEFTKFVYETSSTVLKYVYKKTVAAARSIKARNPGKTNN